eukprot:1161787-Pelagomonas_calceolata.AAC.2
MAAAGHQKMTAKEGSRKGHQKTPEQDHTKNSAIYTTVLSSLEQHQPQNGGVRRRNRRLTTRN